MTLGSTVDRLRLGLVVNAGGKSRRMGQTKALLTLPNGEPLIRHVVARLVPLAQRTVVVADDPAVAAAVGVLPHVRVVGDRWPEGGALGGIATGLGAMDASPNDESAQSGLAHDGWVMVVACDMPWVAPERFRWLAEQRPRAGGRAVVPVWGGRAQPFHALWHVAVVPLLAARIEAGELGVIAALEALDADFVVDPDADGRPYANVNTPAEWEAFLAQSG